ncbi:RNA recognition motif domain-containing protein [Ditylenchus destructor]|nr:RNA recognition motif domain-containing protein [Ditylenchus destructor]
MYYAICFTAASVYLLLVYLWALCVNNSEQWKRIQFNFAGVAVALSDLFLAKVIIFLVTSSLQLFERTFYARKEWCFSLPFLYGSCDVPADCHASLQFVSRRRNEYNAYDNCSKSSRMTFNILPFGLALLFIALIVFHSLCFFAFARVAYEGARRPRRCRQCGGWHCQSCAPRQSASRMFHSRRTLRLVSSYFRPLPIHFNKFSNNLRHFSLLGPNYPIKSSVNYEETRNFCTSPILKCYSAYPEEKLLSAANRNCQSIGIGILASPIYSRQKFFSSSSRFNDSQRSERDARTLFVAGLSKDTTEDSLRKYFRKKNWDMTDCRIIRDKNTGASRQFGFVEMATIEEAELASKDRHFIDCKVVNVRMNGNKELEEKYRIFVGGLLKETSKETLHEHFSQFGDVHACVVHYNEDNLSRGFGSVTYKSQDSVDRALNSQPHSIDNKVVTVKHATIRPRDLTMFVGNLSPKTTDESLRKHFSKYGQLSDCYVKVDRKTELSRGFGYVSFGSKEELERARAAHPHTIDGVEVTFHSKGQTLVVDSLSPNITKDSLQKFFSQYGKVQDCAITKNSVGRTTGFVVMSNEDETSRALADRPHYIQDKLVSTHQKGEEFTLLLYDLPSNTTDKDLEDMFSKVCKPIYWTVIRNRKLNPNFPTINGYVSFSSAEEVDRVMERSDQYSINGKLLTIQRKVMLNIFICLFIGALLPYATAFVPLEDFYGFGLHNGDQELPKTYPTWEVGMYPKELDNTTLFDSIELDPPFTMFGIPSWAFMISALLPGAFEMNNTAAEIWFFG